MSDITVTAAPCLALPRLTGTITATTMVPAITTIIARIPAAEQAASLVAVGVAATAGTALTIIGTPTATVIVTVSAGKEDATKTTTLITTITSIVGTDGTEMAGMAVLPRVPRLKPPTEAAMPQ